MNDFIKVSTSVFYYYNASTFFHMLPHSCTYIIPLYNSYTILNNISSFDSTGKQSVQPCVDRSPSKMLPRVSTEFCRHQGGDEPLRPEFLSALREASQESRSCEEAYRETVDSGREGFIFSSG